MQRELLDIEVQIAREAKRLRSDLLGDYFTSEHDRIFNELRSVSTPDEAWALHVRLRAIDDLRSHLNSLIDTGKLAAHQLDNEPVL